MTTGLVQEEHWCVFLLMQELMCTPNVGRVLVMEMWRCLMGMWKCRSKWCRNFSYLQYSFRICFVFFLFQERNCCYCLPFNLALLILFLLFMLVGWGELIQPKQLAFITSLPFYQHRLTEWTGICLLASKNTLIALLMEVWLQRFNDPDFFSLKKAGSHQQPTSTTRFILCLFVWLKTKQFYKKTCLNFLKFRIKLIKWTRSWRSVHMYTEQVKVASTALKYATFLIKKHTLYWMLLCSGEENEPFIRNTYLPFRVSNGPQH